MPQTDPAGSSEQNRARLIQEIRRILPVLGENAERADRDSRLPSESVAVLRAAGLFRVGVPHDHGGLELGPTAVLTLTTEIAKACPSSAWIVMTSYVAQHLAANVGGQARAEIWASGPDDPLCGSFNGTELVTQHVEGGQCISGRWPWASGCYHASWAALSVPFHDENGVTADRGLALVPLSALSVEDTWDMIGMRGTGSATLVADRVFVPHHRIRRFAEFLHPPRTPHQTIYDIPVGSLAVTAMGPALGASRALFRLTLDAATKPMPLSSYPRRADSPSTQANIADAAVLLDSAQLHLERSARFVETTALSGDRPNLIDRARVRMDAAHASICLKRATSLMLTVSGASGFAIASPIQRFWRDLETALQHPMLHEGTSREMYGRALVGIEKPISPMI